MQTLRERFLSQMETVPRPWAHPATLSDNEVETELAQVELSLTEATGPRWELEARQWRLRFEQKFRHNGAKRRMQMPIDHGTYRSNVR